MDEICNGRDDDCDGNVDEGLEAQQETCNAQDDDCDGRVDEGHDADGNGTIEVGETFDKDDDGFNTCGSNCDEPDGSCAIDDTQIDCNDTEPVEGNEGGRFINPMAMERCDGTDNDCDGNAFPLGEPDATCIAPRDTLCGGGQICEPDVGCIPLDCNSGRACSSCGAREICVDGDCEPTDCDSAVCEAAGQFCGTGPDCQDRRTNGSECSRDVECVSGFCAPGTTLGFALDGICFQPCCTDSRCPSGQYCYGPGTGARSCIDPDTSAGVAIGRPDVGSGGAGATCSTGSDCRSGLCQGTTCFGSCAQSSECPESCGLTSEGPGCRSGGDVLDPCSSGSQCAMEICDNMVCQLQACTSTLSCPDIPTFAKFCDPVAIGPAGGPFVAMQACSYIDAPTEAVPNQGHGDECDIDFCQTASQCCLGGVCLGPAIIRQGCTSGTCLSGRCTETCCDDTSCPGTDVCRPQSRSLAEGTFFPMFCVPPA